MRRTVANGTRIGAGVAVLIFAITLGGVACNGPAAPGGASGPDGTSAHEPMELRTYDVVGPVREQLIDTLNSLLRTPADGPIGRVIPGPQETLIVLAPERIHRGLERMLNDQRAGGLSFPEPAPIRASYWFVLARPGTRGQAPAAPASLDGRLEPLAPALEAITRADGPRAFRLLERIDITSSGTGSGEAKGRATRVRQQLTRVEDGALARIQLWAGRENALETDVRLKPGQFVVLGQAGFVGRDTGFAPADGNELTLYYVLTTDL